MITMVAIVVVGVMMVSLHDGFMTGSYHAVEMMMNKTITMTMTITITMTI